MTKGIAEIEERLIQLLTTERPADERETILSALHLIRRLAWQAQGRINLESETVNEPTRPNRKSELSRELE